MNIVDLLIGFVIGYLMRGLLDVLRLKKDTRTQAEKDAFSDYLEELEKNGNKKDKFDPHSSEVKIIHFPKKE